MCNLCLTKFCHITVILSIVIIDTSFSFLLVPLREPTRDSVQTSCRFKGKWPISENCQKFVECVDGVSVHGDCGPDKIFDVKSAQCAEPRQGVYGHFRKLCDISTTTNDLDGSLCSKSGDKIRAVSSSECDNTYLVCRNNKYEMAKCDQDSQVFHPTLSKCVDQPDVCKNSQNEGNDNGVGPRQKRSNVDNEKSTILSSSASSPNIYIASKNVKPPNLYVDNRLRRLKTTIRETETEFFEQPKNGTKTIKAGKSSSSSMIRPKMRVKLKETETIYDESDEGTGVSGTTRRPVNLERNRSKYPKNKKYYYFSDEESDDASDDEGVGGSGGGGYGDGGGRGRFADHRNAVIESRRKPKALTEERRRIKMLLRALKKPRPQNSDMNEGKISFNYVEYEATPVYEYNYDQY